MMKDIAFVLWVCLWPVSVTFDSLLTAKRKAITGEEPISKGTDQSAALITVVIWIAVAVSLKD